MTLVCSRHFSRVDTNGDGMISKEELVKTPAPPRAVEVGVRYVALKVR